MSSVLAPELVETYSPAVRVRDLPFNRFPRVKRERNSRISSLQDLANRTTLIRPRNKKVKNLNQGLERVPNLPATWNYDLKRCPTGELPNY